MSAWGTLVVAVATLCLAFFTWRLGLRTREMAERTSDAVAIAERELIVLETQAAAMNEQVEASIRQALASELALADGRQPTLVPVVQRDLRQLRVVAADGTTTHVQVGADGMAWRDTHFALWAVIPVRNVGPGVAIIKDQSNAAILLTPGQRGSSLVGRPTSRVVAPSDVIDVVFRAEATSPALVAQGVIVPVYVKLEYTDASGSRSLKSEFRYERIDGPTLYLSNVTVGLTDDD